MESIGFGKDIHKLIKSKTNIVLGGCTFESNYKIVAYSDGDIILHSIADAIFGACQCGDIGLVFPDTDKKNKNIDSKIILNYALKKAKEKSLKISNIDITVIADKIYFQPLRQQIISSLSQLLKTRKINIKATRFERGLNLIECDTIVLLKGTKYD